MRALAAPRQPQFALALVEQAWLIKGCQQTLVALGWISTVTLRVHSYSLRKGGEHRLASIGNIIRRQRPPAVALLEAAGRAHARTLARDLGMELLFGVANSENHAAQASRLPIRRSEIHRLAGLALKLRRLLRATEP